MDAANESTCLDLFSIPLLPLRSILVSLDASDLASLACVSRGARAIANDEDVWQELFFRLNPTTNSTQLNEALSLPAPQGWRHSLLYQVPKSTEPVGGSGGGPFDVYDTAYSQELRAMRLQQRLTPHGPIKPLYSEHFPQLAAPVCSEVTCKYITSIDIWLRNGRLRAMQLEFADPGQGALQTWSRIVGAGDVRETILQRPPFAPQTLFDGFPPSFQIKLHPGEHITRAKVSEGSGHFARLAVLGLQFGTSLGRTFSCGEFQANVERVCDFTFPQRLTSIWGRSGWIVDQLGFEYL